MIRLSAAGRQLHAVAARAADVAAAAAVSPGSVINSNTSCIPSALLIPFTLVYSYY